MKKSIIKITSYFLLSGVLLASCNSPEKKVENAQKEVVEANKDLDKANQEYITDVENYRKETAERIAENDSTIADYKSRVAEQKKNLKADYLKKVTALEKQNSDMKMRMENYKEEGKEKWEIFKTEYTHDMDAMTQAFRNLTVKNVKPTKQHTL